MKFFPLVFTPGINREGTNYSGKGGWWDCNLVRFRNGFPETIGGWTKYSDTSFLGNCRSLFHWGALSGAQHIGMGTHLKYYVDDGGTPIDITPIRVTTAAGDVTFAASNGSSTITVTDLSHDATANDFVTFSGAVSLGGNVTAAILNDEHQIVSIIDNDNYTITVSVTANASDTGNGGAAVVGEYQIHAGVDAFVGGTGFGAGTYGASTYGTPRASAVGQFEFRLWSADNFGEDLLINPRGGNIYYMDYSAGIDRAIALEDLAGAESAPTVANKIIVSDVDRHVIAFGADDEFTPGTQDPLLIRFSDQESVTDWRTMTTNTAGSLRLSSGSEIITAIQTKREIAVFTDRSLYAMQWIGPPYTFGIQEVSRDISIISQESAIAVNDVVYWMSDGKFMRYDGVVSELPCAVKEYVFSSMYPDGKEKVVAGHNLEFSEIWWFYPTTSASGNDAYVIYNYEQNIWYYGSLNRTAWLTQGPGGAPVAAGIDGYLYVHESGLNDGSTNPASGLNCYIQSSDLEVEDGDSFVFATRLIPDMTFRASTSGSPIATFTVSAHDYPGATTFDTDSGDTQRSVSTPVEGYTNQLPIRIRGRAFSMKVESNDSGVAWRVGRPRLSVRTDGRR